MFADTDVNVLGILKRILFKIYQQINKLYPKLFCGNSVATTYWVK